MLNTTRRTPCLKNNPYIGTLLSIVLVMSVGSQHLRASVVLPNTGVTRRMGWPKDNLGYLEGMQ